MNEGQLAQLSVDIDQYIYGLIKAYFHNYRIFHGFAVPDMIKAYQRYGTHQIDFTKIYGDELGNTK